jgi:hypothetical protein
MTNEDQELRLIQMRVIELEDEIMQHNKRVRELQSSIDEKLLPALNSERVKLRAILAN